MSLIRQAAILLVLVAIAAGGYFAWQEYTEASDGTADAPQQRGGGGPVVSVAAVSFDEIERVVEAVGSTRASRAVEIAPSASGRVTEVTFHAGKRVEQGEILLRLDEEIERADLAEAEAQLREAGSALQRARALMKSSATTQAAVEKLVVTQATAQAERDRAARRLADRTIVAPFAGTVGFPRVEVGARVDPGEAITTLDDLALVEIEFSLPEALYGQVSSGKPVIATATAFPDREFGGVVDRIDSRIDPVSRAFRARAVVSNPDYALPAGMFMHLTVVLDSRRALTVPEESLIVEGAQPYVLIVADTDGRSRAERRNVSIGQRSFGSVEITDGVAEGERVIIRGVQKARDGAPVRVGTGGGNARSGPGSSQGGGRPAEGGGTAGS